VYAGDYISTGTYYCTATLVSIVSYMGRFYLAANGEKSGLANWGLPITSDWTIMGVQYQSIATGLLLTQDAVVTQILTLGQSGSNVGIIQSANYVPGSVGFKITAAGYAEFNGAVFTGSISAALIGVGTVAFNPVSYSANTFPITGNVAATNTTGTTISSVKIIDVVTVEGWGVGGAGFAANRYGQSAMVFKVDVSGDYTIPTQTVVTDLVYSLDSGASWTVFPGEWEEISSSEIHSFGMSISLTLTGLLATGTIHFGIKCTAGDPTSVYNACTMNVTCFNL
jgi:hypothetical protein